MPLLVEEKVCREEEGQREEGQREVDQAYPTVAALLAGGREAAS